MNSDPQPIANTTDWLDALSACGQHEMAQHAHSLPIDAREKFLAPLSALGLGGLEQIVAAMSAPESRVIPADSVAPPEIVTVTRPLSGADLIAFEKGEALLAQGHVAVVVVAGGMGSRLGWPGPKGTFPIGPITERSLFQLFAEQIRAIQQRLGARLPWAVQTSPENHLETLAFFRDHDHFGLPADQIKCFQQGTVPVFDTQGRMALDSHGDLLMLPDGHGGVFTAMSRRGVLEWLAVQGIEHVFYFQVDNPLCDIADPLFLGHHAHRGSEMSTKVVNKTDASERVGVLARVHGVHQVIEYSELDAALAAQRDQSGHLLLRGGNTAIHAFTLDFLERTAAANDLDYHVAAKPIPAGPGAAPDAKSREGLKAELFVFDAMKTAQNPFILEVERADEFAPVKSRDGVDTPAQARDALSRRYRNRLSEVGVVLPDDQQVELSPMIETRGDALAEAAREALRQSIPMVLGEEKV